MKAVEIQVQSSELLPSFLMWEIKVEGKKKEEKNVNICMELLEKMAEAEETSMKYQSFLRISHKLFTLCIPS